MVRQAHHDKISSNIYILGQSELVEDESKTYNELTLLRFFKCFQLLLTFSFTICLEKQ